jgi:predicted dehydrogenase
MLKIGIVGCGFQAATISGYLGIYGDDYEVTAVMDINFVSARARLAEKQVKLDVGCRFYDDLKDFVAKEVELDGIIIGTPCNLHTEVACALEQMNTPIYMEKPVSIHLDQLQRLYAAFKNSSVPVEVSLPMRLCPLTLEVKKIIDSGTIGTVEQLVAYNDVGYGAGYFSSWYRDFEKTGGMFMQKAVHDIDYLLFLAGQHPREVCAMRTQRVFGGDKPFDLSCDQCKEQKQCHESPYNYFHERNAYSSVADAVAKNEHQMCRFSKNIKIDDIGECIIQLENGAHLSYHQNFFARNAAHRRGARIYGYRGTVEMDFSGRIKVMSHFRNHTEEITVPPGPLSHYGGDKELVMIFCKP